MAHAYTLSSFLSRLNPGGTSIRAHARSGCASSASVMQRVRARVGDDFPIGVRFLGEECIKDGYALPDAQRIALRLARRAPTTSRSRPAASSRTRVHKPGEPLYPYTGYSGDRCMPGDWYPALPHAGLAAAIKRYINDKGYSVPVASVGKISDPTDAERLLAEGQADLIGMARQLLSDPDWVRKVEEKRPEKIIRCIYCNVCKQLDENFKLVSCFLWPKGAIQAPREDLSGTAPDWGAGGAGLAATVEGGTIRLSWRRAAGAGIAGYDVFRAEDGGAAIIVEAVKGAKYADRAVLGGLTYSYHVMAYDSSGRHSPPSNSVSRRHGDARFLHPSLSSRAMLDPSAHSDCFARDNLPPRALWPTMECALPEIAYPKRLNAAVELLDRMVERGFADRPCIRWPGGSWTYAELLDRANRIANVLIGEMGLVPGNRVLLRAANNPMHVASWFAVLKAGGIAVGTMPLLRARELTYVIDKAEGRVRLV